jgi:hypothetical protein
MADFIGPMGFEIPQSNATIAEKVSFSKQVNELFQKDNPVAYRQRDDRPLLPELAKAFDNFQVSKGRASGSLDLSLIVEFVFGKPMPWLPQLIGSCVFSNTFRVWVERMCVEICLHGHPEAYIGSTEFGPTSIAPHCVTYGLAREIANMRGSDGLYCAPMRKALFDGVVLCSTPKVKELHVANGANNANDYPEPQPVGLYRKIGDWAWNSALRPYLACSLSESVDVTSVDGHRLQENQMKTMFMCSGIAIKKIGTHKDGFPIHGIDPNNSWSHNMGWSGFRLASDGDRFSRLSNRSWTRPGQNPEELVYNIPESEMQKIYRKDVDVASIGEIEGIPIVYPSV